MCDAESREWLLPGAVRDPQSAVRDPRAPVPQQIDGVMLRPYHPVETGYGRLSEVLRSEWLGANATVDQVFVSTLRPGKVSAWHAHETATDRLFVVSGTLLVVLFDHRPNSPTRGVLQQFTLGWEAQAILIIPPTVWHGIKNIGEKDVSLLNAVDIGYCYENPDHWRVPAESNAIPFRF